MTMRFERTERGFGVLIHDTYANEPVPARLVQHSSAIGDYADSWDRPGTSYLWVGDRHHLNREEVAQLILHLESWLMTGSLEIDDKQAPVGQGG